MISGAVTSENGISSVRASTVLPFGRLQSQLNLHATIVVPGVFPFGLKSIGGE